MVIYGIVPPICLGLVILLPIHCAWHNFPESKGLTTGIIKFAFGISTFFFNFLSVWLVNPTNLKATIEAKIGGDIFKFYDHDVADNVPFMLRTLASIYFVFGITGSLMIHYPGDPGVDLEDDLENNLEDKLVNN